MKSISPRQHQNKRPNRKKFHNAKLKAIGGGRYMGSGRGNVFEQVEKRFNPKSRHRKQNAKQLNPQLFINKAQEIADSKRYVANHTFSDFSLDKKVLQNLAQKGYEHPTEIQDMVIKHALAKRDVIGLSNTGTGKTAAFLLPIISHLLQDSSSRSKALILAPTRELAFQIKDELESFTKGLALKHVLTVGGTPINRNLQQLRQHNDVVVGTPGRIVDLIKRRALSLENVTHFVLDECDRMLDMGFIDDITFVMKHLSKEEQILLFSATMPKEIEKIVKSFLKDPVKVSVIKQQTANHIEQSIVSSTHAEKYSKLMNLFKTKDINKAIIFTRTKLGAENLARKLKHSDYRAQSIHGDKSQRERNRALRQFTNNTVRVLVATDVAARGIDIDDITHVINYDAPEHYDDYVHRVGRTGRAGRAGEAITFVEA